MKKALSLILTALMLVSVLSVFATSSVTAADLNGSFTTAANGWDGKALTAPKGEGTAENPYLIENAANLNWLRNAIPKGDQNKEGVDYSPAFDGKYFEQTADIDLNGKSISSIGYYYHNAERMGAFAGTYNGNGFKIFNGTISAANKGHDLNDKWGNGLFGVIYGATLKNITLENVIVQGYGITGALVGRAVSTDSTGKTVTNTIENCSVKDTVIDVNFPTGKAKTASYYDRSRAGGICGWASGTEFLYCSTENVDLLVPANFVHMGGIVGTVDDFVIVDHCIGDTDITIQYGNTGNTISDGTAANTQQSGEAAMGGIVGFIFSKAVEKDNANACVGGVTITNCINTGSGRVISTDITAGETLCKATGATYYGGILGGFNVLDFIDNDTTTYDYYIGNCHNATAFTISTVAPGTTGNTIRLGGIVGSGFISKGAAADTLYVEDCLSVDVQENSYNNCNEFVPANRDRLTTKNLPSVYPLGVNAYTAAGAAFTVLPAASTGATYATRALGDYIYVAKADGTGYELSATTTFQNVVDELKADIELAQDLGKAVVAIGHQKGLDGTNNEGAYRIVFGLHKLDYCNVGVSVIKAVEGGATTAAAATSDVLYTSVKAFTKDGEKEISAEEKGVEYLTTLTIGDIPTTGTVTYTVKTYVTNRDTAKTRTAGDTVVLTFVNGALQSAVVR